MRPGPGATDISPMSAIVVLVWVACAALGYAIGNPKGRATAGVLLGLLLGIIGLIIIACLKPKQQVMAYGPYGAYGPAVAGPNPYLQPMPAAGALQATGPHWAPDPSGRHQLRWWTGSAWTDNVTDNGVPSVDVLVAR
jgi:hypothetical protein